MILRQTVLKLLYLRKLVNIIKPLKYWKVLKVNFLIKLILFLFWGAIYELIDDTVKAEEYYLKMIKAEINVY